MRNRSDCARSSRWRVKFLACWGNPGSVGVGGATGEMDAPCGGLDEHQHVDSLERHGFNGEEVARHHARSLLSLELPPGRAAPPGSRSEATAAKQLSDRRGRYLDPPALRARPGCACIPISGSLLRGAGSAPVALPAAAAFLEIACCKPTSGGTSSRWGHEETLPASPWQSSGRGGQKCPIGRSKARPLGLAPKDAQFVTEHDDLEILGLALAIWDQQR